MDKNTHYWVIAGLASMMTNSGSLMNPWQRLITRYAKLQADPFDSDGVELFNFRHEPLRYWCPLLSCWPDHGGIRVSHVINDEAISNRLVEQLNKHFLDREMSFDSNQNGIFLVSDKTLPKGWPSVVELINKNLFDFIGAAHRAIYWHSFINEVQMLVAQDQWLQSKNINSIWVEPIPWWIYCEQAVKNDNFTINIDSIFAYLHYQPQLWQATLETSYNELMSWLRSHRFSSKKLIISDTDRCWKVSRFARFMVK